MSNYLLHSRKGSTWKRHKYSGKKIANGKTRYIYNTGSTKNKNYNWLEDLYGEDEYDAYVKTSRELDEAERAYNDFMETYGQKTLDKALNEVTNAKYASRDPDKQMKDLLNRQDKLLKDWGKAMDNYNNAAASYNKTAKSFIGDIKGEKDFISKNTNSRSAGKKLNKNY